VNACWLVRRRLVESAGTRLWDSRVAASRALRDNQSEEHESWLGLDRVRVGVRGRNLELIAFNAKKGTMSADGLQTTRKCLVCLYNSFAVVCSSDYVIRQTDSLSVSV